MHYGCFTYSGCQCRSNWQQDLKVLCPGCYELAVFQRKTMRQAALITLYGKQYLVNDKLDVYDLGRTSPHMRLGILDGGEFLTNAEVRLRDESRAADALEPHVLDSRYRDMHPVTLRRHLALEESVRSTASTFTSMHEELEAANLRLREKLERDVADLSGYIAKLVNVLYLRPCPAAPAATQTELESLADEMTRALVLRLPENERIATLTAAGYSPELQRHLVGSTPTRESPASKTDSPPAAQAIGACVICLSAPSSHAMVPCGHLCMCVACSEQGAFAQCPICRGRVESTLKIHNSGQAHDPDDAQEEDDMLVAIALSQPVETPAGTGSGEAASAASLV